MLDLNNTGITHLRYLEVQANKFHLHFNIQKQTISNIKENNFIDLIQKDSINYRETTIFEPKPSEVVYSENHFLCSLVNDKFICQAFPIYTPVENSRISCSSKNYDVDIDTLKCVFIDDFGAEQYLYDHKQNVMINFPKTVTLNKNNDSIHKIVSIDYKDDLGASGLMYSADGINNPNKLVPYFLSYGKGMLIAKGVDSLSTTTYAGYNALSVSKDINRPGLEFLTFTWKVEVQTKKQELQQNFQTSISIGGSKGSSDAIVYDLIINQNLTIMSDPNSYLQPQPDQIVKTLVIKDETSVFP